MYTADDFSPELAWIKNDSIREFARFCLERIPPYFYEVPSSSTGKYHSAWSNGPGGLVRHTKATAYVAKELARAYDLTEQETDAAITACLLHDCVKYGVAGGKHTTSYHDYEGAKFVHGLRNLYGQEVPMLSEICAGIAWHFGTFTKRSNGHTVKKFPEEYSKIEHLVHIADMVASRKDINFNFITDSLIG